MDQSSLSRQEKIVVTYTDDFSSALSHAALVASGEEITPDDMFRGCFLTIQQHPYGSILWNLLGFTDIKPVEKLYRRQYARKDAQLQRFDAADAEREANPQEEKLIERERCISQSLQERLDALVNESNTHVDIITLFSASFDHLSSSLVSTIYRCLKDVEILSRTVKLLLSTPRIRQE